MEVTLWKCCSPPDLIFLTESEGERTYYCYQCAPIPGYKWIDKHDWRKAIGDKALPHLFCSVCGVELTFGSWLQDHPGGGSVNLFLAITDGAFHLCEVGTDDGPCMERATWFCHPQGYLTVKIYVCDKHKQEAESGEREQAE